MEISALLKSATVTCNVVSVIQQISNMALTINTIKVTRFLTFNTPCANIDGRIKYRKLKLEWNSLPKELLTETPTNYFKSNFAKHLSCSIISNRNLKLFKLNYKWTGGRAVERNVENLSGVVTDNNGKKKDVEEELLSISSLPMKKVTYTHFKFKPGNTKLRKLTKY